MAAAQESRHSQVSVWVAFVRLHKLPDFFKTFTISTLKTSKIKFYFVLFPKLTRGIPFVCSAENVHNHFVEIVVFVNIWDGHVIVQIF